ncbi:MAG: sugar phosphate isomerase/epimerase family protein [Beutenbergiaceae bacterium]
MKFANAPVSYGVFGELTIEGASTTDLLSAMAQAGYHGTELGPPGFFGSPTEAADALRTAGLTAAGVYVPLHTQDRGPVLQRDLERFEITMAEMAAADATGPLILADEGDAALLREPRKNPGRMLDEEGWQRLLAVLTQAARQAEDHGLMVSVHPHISTYIELPSEIERLLTDTDLSLTFDVGHIVLAGGDGPELYQAWRERINHVHVKDVRPQVLEQARASGREDFDSWWEGVATPLGAGDGQVQEFCTVLAASGYDGWVVVEQDRAPLTAHTVTQVFAEQSANLRWLERTFAAVEAPTS